MAITRPVSFDLGDQILPFVKRIPAQMVDVGQAVTGQTDAELGAKLDRLVEFATDDASNVRLTGAM